MQVIDKDWFIEQGIKGLSDDEVALLTESIMAELSLRIGDEIAQYMTDEQLERFNAARDAGDEEEQLAIVEEACPNYAAIVDAEADRKIQEVRKLGTKEALLATVAKDRQDK